MHRQLYQSWDIVSVSWSLSAGLLLLRFSFSLLYLFTIVTVGRPRLPCSEELEDKEKCSQNDQNSRGPSHSNKSGPPIRIDTNVVAMVVNGFADIVDDRCGYGGGNE